ncbi:hypothetical protein M3Y97_01125000 [Aphelenchoides bicaudatus]|nr:hypothetical protein M3Y97_01125000 [Aphelenchoides bicaudatus]
MEVDQSMILKFYILVVAILVALKSAVMFFWLSEGTIDDRLAWSFIADRCVYLFISTTCTAGMTWIICVVQFYYLSRFIKKYRFCAQSLSEMFQIRQTAHVIEVVIPLLGAYCAAVVFSGTCMIIILYLYFIEGHSVLSPYYLVVANAAYYSIPFYTLFSTVFMSWYFKAMRKVMIQDLKSLFGIEISHQTDVHPEKLDPRRRRPYLLRTIARVVEIT